jgi:hypothetical protein
LSSTHGTECPMAQMWNDCDSVWKLRKIISFFEKSEIRNDSG